MKSIEKKYNLMKFFKKYINKLCKFFTHSYSFVTEVFDMLYNSQINSVCVLNRLAKFGRYFRPMNEYMNE